ncbi:MAG: hypothetical protein K6G83_11715 [Lachnospiraceae bacterium]|nr:hypothetical protein [Lachnospiraceae bacterium]
METFSIVRKKTGLSGLNVISVVVLILSVIFMLTLKDAGIRHVLQWVTALFTVSFFMRPLLTMKRLRLFDGGFSLSLGLGIGISFLPVWFLSASGLVRFDTGMICLCFILLTIAVNILSFRKYTVFQWNRDEFDRFLFGFALFTFFFAVAFFVKGYKPFLDSQTEQFMDYGFMQSMYRQQILPPEDMWFSGERLNYYYLGHACATWLCRLSFTRPEYGYNLIFCTIFAGLFWMIFSLLEALLRVLREKNRPFGRKSRLLGACVGALLVVFAGNGHYLIYGLLLPFLENVTKKELVKDFWFPDSTVFIGSTSEALDKGKHEYPSYSVVLGDLHAHVLNMLFTIPLLSLLFDYAADAVFLTENRDDTGVSDPSIHKNNQTDDLSRVLKMIKGKDYREEIQSVQPEAAAAIGPEEAPGHIRPLSFRELISGRLILIGLLLGLYCGVNYWDFPIYFVVSGAIILFCDYKKYGLNLKTTGFVLLKGGVIFLISKFCLLPFHLTFDKISSEIGICDRHSPLWQFALVWGFRICGCLLFAVYLICRVFRKKADAMELSLLAVVLCGIGLIFIPELIYVKDIYGEDYQRFNTMFKLTYQGYILLGFGIGAAVAVFFEKKGIYRACAVAASVLTLLSATYLPKSAQLWFGNVFVQERAGISVVDPLRNYANEYGFEWGAMEKLLEDDREILHIVEVAGTSYQPDDKLSVYTGACTVVGWYVHEWLWRGDPALISLRSGEVRYFYECGDPAYTRDFVERYGIDYVYVGPREYYYYNVAYGGLAGLGEEVWNNEGYTLIRIGEGAE